MGSLTPDEVVKLKKLQKALKRDSYERHKTRAANRARQQSEDERDIGEIPDVADPSRRERCGRSFRAFCEEYFRSKFQQDGEFWPWSDAHLAAFAKIEAVVRYGGQTAYAMPRGAGKTCICECAILWAVLYGYHQFVGIFGPDFKIHAKTRIRNLCTMLVSQPLVADFPETCYPLVRLEGINQRKLLYRGTLLRSDDPLQVVTKLKVDSIELPNIPNMPAGVGSMEVVPNPACGAIIYAAGLTGQIRGPNITRDDGTTMRPTLVLIDDPQTRASAKNPSQCDYREQIITGDILGLPGPGQEIAAMMPCTVIYPDDLAARLLDRERNPHWQGERSGMVLSWPKDESWWAKYAEVRREHGDKRKRTKACNALYVRDRAAADEGGVVSWEHRKLPDEVSALQSAWNIRIDRKDFAFFAEYQNDPLPEVEFDDEALKAEDIAKRTNGHKRGVVPNGVNRITAFVDVQQKALYWLVVGWEDNFTGAVLDYGTEPDQRIDYVTLRNIKRTLSRATPGAGIEGAIYAGLERLAERILAREWKRDDGTPLRIEQCMIDANWAASTEVVYRFCRQSQYAAILLPSHGKGVTAAGLPMGEWKKKAGERMGLNWRLGPAATRGRLRRVMYDTNFWKTFIAARLRTAMGDAGALTFFGRQVKTHRCLVDHLTAERSVKTEGRGRKVDQWTLFDKSRDNHWFDCLVGGAVAASIRGVALPGTEVQVIRRRRRTERVKVIGNAIRSYG